MARACPCPCWQEAVLVFWTLPRWTAFNWSARIAHSQPCPAGKRQLLGSFFLGSSSFLRCSRFLFCGGFLLCRRFFLRRSLLARRFFANLFSAFCNQLHRLFHGNRLWITVFGKRCVDLAMVDIGAEPAVFSRQLPRPIPDVLRDLSGWRRRVRVLPCLPNRQGPPQPG